MTMALFAALAAPAAVDVSKLPPPAGRPVDFVKDIQPIFANSCYQCHRYIRNARIARR